ncbi:MAG: Holliday junction branch migration protein RuvA, partial [Anaerolineaceae bacterium]|nr:Holliday junction branch migration protein RuvA [Anaerolineaceae bacterium]
MIANVHGEVVSVGEDNLVIDVGGVGLRVQAPAALCQQTQRGERIRLHTFLVVREDALSLYGFEREAERDFFLLLLGVNGVGPRLALAILSSLSLDVIRLAVLREQPDVLARVPGVGKKTAQKIVLHLQGRVGEGFPLGVPELLDVDTEVVQALTSLGYSVVEA